MFTFTSYAFTQISLYQNILHYLIMEYTVSFYFSNETNFNNANNTIQILKTIKILCLKGQMSPVRDTHKRGQLK